MACVSGIRETTIHVNMGTSYRISLSGWTQTNINTGTTRAMRLSMILMPKLTTVDDGTVIDDHDGVPVEYSGVQSLTCQ